MQQNWPNLDRIRLAAELAASVSWHIPTPSSRVLCRYRKRRDTRPPNTPNRVAGMVYLEAGYPYAFDNGKGPSMKEFLDARKLMQQPPPPSESRPGSASVAAFQQAGL